MRAQPVAKDYKIWEAGLSFEESNARMVAYLADQKAYRSEIDAYVRKNGCDSLSKQKLKALLAGNLIQSTGGKAILKWRWQEFCAGRPVLRSRNYLREKPPPDHTLLAPVPGVGFLGLPLDVWYHCIFKFMNDHTLISVMFTSRQLQARAHIALTVRAKARFGPGGTPMALIRLYHSRRNCGAVDYFHELLLKHRYHQPEACVRICITEYGCMEHVRILKRFRQEQTLLKEADSEQEKRIADQVVAVINSVCPDPLKIERVGRRNCEFMLEILCNHYEGFPLPCGPRLIQYLNHCRYFINNGETNSAVICKKLERFYPSDPFFNVAINWTLPTAIDGDKFFELINTAYEKRGLDWLKRLSIVYDDEETTQIFYILAEEDVYIRGSHFRDLDLVRQDLGLTPYYSYSAHLNAFIKTYKKIKS